VIAFLSQELRLREKDFEFESTARLSISAPKSARESERTREFLQVMKERNQTLEYFGIPGLQPEKLFVGRRGPFLVAPGFEISCEFEKDLRARISIQI